MKTNAPKNIYFNQTEDGRQYLTSAIPFEREYIEYTRTDAFIEKAAEWLNNFYNEDTRSYLIDKDIEKFINYMKDIKKELSTKGEFYRYPQYDEENNLVGFTIDYEGKGAFGKNCKIIATGETL